MDSGKFERVTLFLRKALRGPENGAPARLRSIVDEAVAEIALAIYRVVVEPVAKALAQLRDMALHDVLIDIFAEKAVDEVKDLRFRDATPFVGDQILQNAPL